MSITVKIRVTPLNFMAQLEDPKEEKFAQEYTKDLNGARSARDAGFAAKSARVTASKLLTKPNVRARVKELLAQSVHDTEVDTARIRRELGYLSTSDLTEAFDSNGNPLPIHQIPERLRRCISGFELVEERDENGEPTGHMVKKFKFYDKNASLNTLAKVHKMLTDKVEHKHTVTLEDFLGGSWPDEEDQKGKSPKDKKK